MKKTVISTIVILIVLGAASAFFFSGDPVTNPDPSGTNIICFGDSLTFGTGAEEGMDYPSQLSAMIGKPVINAGVPGDTTADALARLSVDVLEESPRIVLITLGGNDLKNRLDKNTAFDNLRKIVTAIQQQGALVIIGGLRFPIYDRGFSEEYRKLAKETGSVLIPDLYKGIMGNRDLMSDPIHPNGRGYTMMAEKFYKAVQPYL